MPLGTGQGRRVDVKDRGGAKHPAAGTDRGSEEPQPIRSAGQPFS